MQGYEEKRVCDVVHPHTLQRPTTTEFSPQVLDLQGHMSLRQRLLPVRISRQTG